MYNLLLQSNKIFLDICKCLFVFIMIEPVEDPYLVDEEDPAQCRALESSLWEIKVCTVCDGFAFTNESSMTLTTAELRLVSAKVFCHVDCKTRWTLYIQYLGV